MIFIGALIKLLTSGRIAGAGAALAGFGLVLYGLTTLQQGMGGLAERLNPADLPAVLSSPDAGWWAGLLGVLTLVVVGLVMTALMQSSTAAIAVTMSAHFAGAVGLDQACALIIGQNIGTATSSALAAIGASSTAKRLALAYVLFKVIAALIFIALFPFTTPLMVRASSTIDGVTLLALYHTAYNVVGVAVLLPVINRFTALVERILPERGSPLTRCLEPSALATPIVAVEAVRRTVARALGALCGAVGKALDAAGGGEPFAKEKYAATVAEAANALNQAQVFLSDVDGPPTSDDEQRRMTNTLHALDHASRMAELAAGDIDFGAAAGGRTEDQRAAKLAADAMRNAAIVTEEVARQPGIPAETGREPASQQGDAAPSDSTAASMTSALNALARCDAELSDYRRTHRAATLGAVAGGALTANDAIVHVDTVRSLEAIARHAWRSAAHLLGRAT
jgi:phosphate:Na+ symporter